MEGRPKGGLSSFVEELSESRVKVDSDLPVIMDARSCEHGSAPKPAPLTGQPDFRPVLLQILQRASKHRTDALERTFV